MRAKPRELLLVILICAFGPGAAPGQIISIEFTAEMAKLGTVTYLRALKGSDLLCRKAK